jgi:RNA polymerase sigma-70 factor (ECF subfamily)
MEHSEATSKAHGDFLRLFLESERDLYRYVCALLPRPQDARDVVQETALALWENFDRYDAARPFLPWALRFALNKARQHAAREGRRSLLLDDEVLLEKIAAEQELQRPEFEARWQRLRDCLEKLPGEQSGLVRGYYWDRLSTEQLAERARSSVEAVYKRLQRIRVLLLDCVQRLERKDKPLGDDFAS